MNFLVQSLIQDLENMGLYAPSVSTKEWEDKWTIIKQLNQEELKALQKACTENPYRQKAFEKALASDPDPARTARKAAFDGWFKS